MRTLGKHRESIDIVADILKIASEGSRKTQIMYRANLSYTLLQKYLDLVKRCGMLNISYKKYALTTKGKIFLKKYESYVQRRKNIAISILKVLGVKKESRHQPVSVIHQHR